MLFLRKTLILAMTLSISFACFSHEQIRSQGSYPVGSSKYLGYAVPIGSTACLLPEGKMPPLSHRKAVKAELLENRRLLSAATYYVSPKGDDAGDGLTIATAWQHIQQAFNAAPTGSTVDILAGRYREKPTLNVSGSATAGYTTFQAVGSVVIDGSGGSGDAIITIASANYVKLIGFDIVNFHTRSGGAAILFEGSGDHVQLLSNHVQHTQGFEATAIGIYGTDSTQPISNLVVDGNVINDCQPADSETLTLNGNVANFAVTNNTVSNTNNIGIDFIGGEGTSVDPDTGAADPNTDFARDGICANNHVTRAHSNYGGGYGAGIYVDGGQNITIAQNTVNHSDMGIEVGCEHTGLTTTGVIVRDNLLYDNSRAGLAMGGYAANVGRVSDCQFLNNTLYHNEQKPDGNGEIWIQLANNCTIENNLVVAGKQGLLISADTDAGVTGLGNLSDYNLFFTPGNANHARLGWQGETYTGLTAFTVATHQDAHSLFADPALVNPARDEFTLQPNSPAINAGDPAFTPATSELDINGNPRVAGGRVDIGAVEHQ